jgi:L-fuculose-phosphate aldolase
MSDPGRPRPRWPTPAAAFESEEAARLKQEVVDVGRKLWLRQYVDGNGGNISCRLTDEWVLCTPTLMSKFDLRPEDLCLVDMQGSHLAGTRHRSSEILLHLAILKSVPEAAAVVHCHPPHATAYALAGVVPPERLLAEHEVFVGPVALLPYETPGTQACADAVIPYAKDHNSLLMTNHGLVTWADTPTHAEWYVEVLDTTCRVCILTAHLGVSPSQIPLDRIGGLMALKRRLGMPDARFAPAGTGEPSPKVLPGRVAARPRRASTPRPPGHPGADEDAEI